MSIATTFRRLRRFLLLMIMLAVGTGPVAAQTSFIVTVGAKTNNHPNNPDTGFPEAYYINGVEAPVLTLERGTTYTFQMQGVPDIHPFYISTSSTGAGGGTYSDGVTGNMAWGSQTLTFTPSDSTPDLLYYQCGFHEFMGWRINVVDGVNEETETFVAELSGKESVPANASRANGSVAAELSGSTLTLSGTFSGLTTDFNPDIAGGAHIHLGLAGQNGGVDIPLTTNLDENNRSGSFEAADNTFELTTDQVEALRARRYYVNIHTRGMPPGEIRGQLLPESSTVHHAVLSGRASSPSNASPGLGGVLVELNGDEITVSGAFRELASDFNPNIAGGSHLHLAAIGANGPVEVPLVATLAEDNRSGTFEAADNTSTLDADQRQALLDGLLYVNIHTQDIPAGELRGQVLDRSKRVFEASLRGANATTPVPTAASGGSLAVLDESTGDLVFFGSFRDLETDFNPDIAGGAHLHLARAGMNGGINIPLNATLADGDREGRFETADNTFSLSGEQQDALLDGLLYVNIHTRGVPSGELRGQLLPSSNVAPTAPMLTSPAPGETLMIGGVGNVLEFEFSGGSDANFNPLVYRWELARDAGFADVILAHTMAGGSASISHDDLWDRLLASGYRAGQRDSVFHRLSVGDGSLDAASVPEMLRFELGLTVFERTIELEEIAAGLAAPVTLREAPDESGRLFVVDQAGSIRIIHSEGELAPEPFLDVRDRMVELRDGFDERGLLGLAFHPDFEQNGRFFVYYSAPLRDGAPEGFNHTGHISEFMVSDDDPDRADHDSERILLQVDQPQANHNGGTLEFGPADGFLYISLGDGGGSNDTADGHVDDWYDVNDGGNGQDVEQNLLGAILRIDVDGGDAYAIPADNPFVDRDGLDEIYAYGFRNPYRFSFDIEGDHDLLVGDVGQRRWEEINRVELGGNYGWNVYEGTHCFNAADSSVDLATCPTEVGDGHPDAGAALIGPVIEYANLNQGSGLGIAVVGGYVYRGSEIPDLAGRYVFGDWSRSFGEPTGRLFVAEPADEGLWTMQMLHNSADPEGDLGHYLLGLGQDRSGEMYVLTTDVGGPTGTTGRVYRMRGAGMVPAEELPDRIQTLVLDAGYPNPFSSSVTMTVRTAHSGAMRAAVYDVLGREVATLFDGTVHSDAHMLTWDGTDGTGRAVASGIYFVRVHSGNEVRTRPITLAR